MAQVVDNFEAYATGELNGVGSWSGTNGQFTVVSTPTNTGSRAVSLAVNGDYRIGKTFTSTAADSQVFYLRTGGMNSTDFFGVGVQNSTDFSVNTHMNTLVIAQNGGTYTFRIQANANTDFDGTPALNTWYKMELAWDGNRTRGAGGTGQVRARVNDGTWSAWVDCIESASAMQASYMRDDIETGNTAYIDDLDAPPAAAAITPPSNLTLLNVG